MSDRSKTSVLMKRLFRPKKLYTYIIKTFIPLLLAGFSVSLFVVVIQFLWQSIGNLVGKGVEALILLRLLFFASMTMVPLALVLGVLIASLMTFGNLGERMELLAMKAAGIPLFKILKPAFYFVTALAIGLFIFQNDWMITSQVKFWQYYFSIKNKAPELAIPEGSFYKGVNNYSIFVGKKDKETKMLYSIMLYDYTNGFDKSMVVVADSARLYSTKEGMELILELYSGESFQNIKRQDEYYSNSADRPFIRERFGYKELHIPFNTDLSMVDESILSSQFVGKNMIQLKNYTDSLTIEIDSLANIGIRNNASQGDYGKVMQRAESSTSQSNMPLNDMTHSDVPATNNPIESYNTSISTINTTPDKPIEIETGNITELLTRKGAKEASDIYASAISQVSYRQNENFFIAEELRENQDLLRKNESEYWRKITYPVACIAFFLIGAPLGALIRKGGMGVPFLVAVSLFIFFYILETFGIKMSREGTLVTWVGMWLPNMVLIPIGLTLCTIATKDTNRWSLDIGSALKRLFTIKTKRKVEYKEVTMEATDPQQAIKDIEALEVMVREELAKQPLSYKAFYTNTSYFIARQRLHLQLEKVVANLRHSRNYTIVDHLNGYPYMKYIIQVWKSQKLWVNSLLMLLLPVGIIPYIAYIVRNKQYIGKLRAIQKYNSVLLELLQERETEI